MYWILKVFPKWSKEHIETPDRVFRSDNFYLEGALFVTIKDLDFAFPFVIFVYGLVKTFVLTSPKLMTIAEERMAPDLVNQFRTKRALGKFCLILGGLWSLQNLWLS